MNNNNTRSIHIKFSKEDDKLLDFVLEKEDMSNQTEAIRRALKFYKKYSKQMGLLEGLHEKQDKVLNLLMEIHLRG
ncbi:hypothetical protein [Herbaspirillum sp. ST 5-3]|uniref:hypothetical protein n=1 Tax=Oxalobacteraceae TaxID=75682 RepID=UPI0010A4BC95|nr:hypothetical protein [Herbaspirillum sp. ST 5-3]